jgi:hypothetical protein
MKDLIQLILQYVPQYLNDLGSLVYRPKRFIAAKNPQTDETFCGIIGVPRDIINNIANNDGSTT